MKARVAAVQPSSHTGPEERRNVDEALSWIQQAAARGAQLVVFPEGYPGPTNPANDYDAMPPLAATARTYEVHVIAGRIEPAGGGRYHVVLRLIDDRGQMTGCYRRTSPRGPYIYHDIDAWGFDYTEAADGLPVFDTAIGRIGMLVCSEVYVPELSRTLALQGADVIAYPAGGAINELRESWRVMVRARAVENLLYTVATQNLYAADEAGIGMVAGPEQILAQSDDRGLVVADLDFDRQAFLRAEDERIVFPKPYATIPGVMRWRRPELYAKLTDQSVVS